MNRSGLAAKDTVGWLVYSPAAIPSQVRTHSHGARTVATVKQRRGPPREPRDANREDCNMNAIATAPARPQHMRALDRANEIRLARAELKRRVAFGKVDVAEVILYCPWEVQSMAVGDLLMSQRRWGHTRCRKFLSQIPMSEKKTVGSMTERQRRTLAAMLGCSGPGRDRAWSATPWVTDSLRRA
jgi:hypothetical protein